MDILTLLTILVIISAGFSYFNQRFLKLPGTIGVVTISVIVSVFIVIIGKANIVTADKVREISSGINFSKVLLDVMLGFLLFASALHFDYTKLKEQRWPVFILSTLGVILSAGIFGTLLFFSAKVINFQIPFIYCCVFGALISPTDPIAVGSILKHSLIPENLKVIISGESLFNDAIGLLLFVTLLGIAQQPDVSLIFSDVAVILLKEVFGGMIIGLIAGYTSYRLIKSIKDFQTILLISLALVLGMALIGSYLHVSIPLAAVTAGLIIGNKSFNKDAVSDNFLLRVWKLIDEVLNTILFAMIGLQLVAMPFLREYWLLGFVSILIILLARIISVSLPALFLLGKLRWNNLFILTWAGLRGGISVAMALSLPESSFKESILSCCYFIVLFSIIGQGLTINRVVKRLGRSKD